MKVYGLRIQPQSPFGTLLKGDTLFGHFCWQTAEDPALLSGGLDQWVKEYTTRPFAIFSSAWPTMKVDGKTVYAITKPLFNSDSSTVLPLSRQRKLETHKEEKRRRWLLIGENLKVECLTANTKSDKELFEIFLNSLPSEAARPLRHLGSEQRKMVLEASQPHNSINRLTMTTGTGQFAPYSHQNHHYLPGMEMTVFIGIDEEALTAETLLTGVKRIGAWGFGRDATSGLGKFEVIDMAEISWPRASENDLACLSLGPLVPQRDAFSRCYGTPFTRFGKHGGMLANSGNPFKKPVVMADDSAVMIPIDRAVFARPYIGTGIRNISAVDQRTVMQGYSLYLPCPWRNV